jgi:flagellar hook-associated protein 1 FlgK
MGNGIFSLGTRAMLASTAMLDTTSHNIANANTEGYSRQETQISTEGGRYTGAGFYGRGVRVDTVNRVTNDFLRKESNINGSTAAADATRLDKLKLLEKTLPTAENGMGYAASQLLNAFVDVANQPQDMSARQVVLARAQEWVTRMNTAGQQLSDLQSGVVLDIGNTVGQINDLAQQIADINQSIAKYNGSGHSPNDLLDQRDLLIKNLGEKVQVSTVAADDGSTSVFMNGGQLLVLGTVAQQLGVVRDPADSTLARVTLELNGTSRILDSSQFTGGELAGLMRVQDGDIASVRDMLDTFGANVADAINRQQALGLDASGTPQTTFDAFGNPVTKPIFINTGSAASIALNLNTPKGLAAASPLVATIVPTNTGTMSISSISMVRAVPGPNAPDYGVTLPLTGQDIKVVFQADSDPTNPTGLIYSFVDSSGNAYKDTTPPRRWAAGTALSDGDPTVSPNDALFSLQINGVPRSGDTITVGLTQYPGANNSNALAMLALRDQSIVSLDGITSAIVTDAYSQMIGNLGVMVQGGRTSADISNRLATDSSEALANSTGVNLDEEAARLIQYQQSYQAAAKVLQIAQSVFDSLLAAMH